MIGFIGFPNVGKSSIINCLIGKKKVSVSRQPGKTKHFQTITLKHFPFSLCDCPGLIFPSLVFNKNDLIINGVFSIDHFKGDVVTLVQIICNIIPFKLCNNYKIDTNIIHQYLNEKGHISYFLDASEFLKKFCTFRKFVSGGKGGQLNFSHATRIIIHDFISGKLLYNFLPDYFKKTSHIYCKNYIHQTAMDNILDNELLTESNANEEILTTKRKFRYMQKKMMKGKNVIKCDKV
ncbi:hypothetical protein C923_05411 [Plasmodium falciparum UGT5.1]|nr:hypothetical protein C923_05411 [Plasmodium falciparum UGT5.1]EWC85667.1 hypothetical protein PFNF54_05334 [Plasmodium falciparum NF54]